MSGSDRGTQLAVGLRRAGVQEVGDDAGHLFATREQEEETKKIWRRLPLIAVRQGRMAFIHPDLISRSTPRILLGAKRICEQIESARHQED